MLSLEKQNEWREEYRSGHPDWHPATEVYASRVRSYLYPESRWLDLGCGRGGLVEQVSHHQAQTIGIDPDFPSLRDHRLPGLPRAVAISDYLPFTGNSFDLITASWLLEHLRNPDTSFSAIGHVLRPGGVFIFITPNGRHPLALLNRLAGRLGSLQGRIVDGIYGRSESDTFPTYYRANTSQRLIAFASAAGLIVERLDFVPDPSYLAFNRPFFTVMCAIENRLSEDRFIHLVGVCRKPGPSRS